MEVEGVREREFERMKEEEDEKKKKGRLLKKFTSRDAREGLFQFKERNHCRLTERNLA